MELDDQEGGIVPMDDAVVSPQNQFTRRGSMSEEEERNRRRSIKAILADKSIPEVERRRSIQQLMDGRRNSLGSRSSTPPTTDVESGTGDYQMDTGIVQQPQQQQLQQLPQQQPRAPQAQQQQQQIPFSDILIHDPNCQIVPVSNEQTKRAELHRPACHHYDRNCTMIAPCCGAAFGCRICHDDCPILPPKVTIQQARRRYPRSSSLPSSFTNMNSTPEDTHHTIDRFAVREVICRKCFTRQSSKT